MQPWLQGSVLQEQVSFTLGSVSSKAKVLSTEQVWAET